MQAGSNTLQPAEEQRVGWIAQVGVCGEFHYLAGGFVLNLFPFDHGMGRITRDHRGQVFIFIAGGERRGCSGGIGGRLDGLFQQVAHHTRCVLWAS
ncbi:hypothetical protein D3C79_826570 [compost metagenome]